MYPRVPGRTDPPQTDVLLVDGAIFGVLLEGPIRGIYIHISPVEPGAAVRRISEVIDIVTFGLEAICHLGIVRTPPSGGDVDFGHL